MVVQNISHMGSSHQIRDLERFAERKKHSMESAHQFSSRPDCSNTAEVPSFTLRTALSAIPFVSDLCGVDVQIIPREIFIGFPNSKELSMQITLGFPSGSKNFCKQLWVSCEVFCFARRHARLHVGDCFEIHNFHWEPCDLLLSSHQNLQLEVRLRHCVFCTGSCNFGPLTDLAIWEELSLRQELYHPRNFLWLLAATPGRSKSWSSFLFCFGFWGCGIWVDLVNGSLRSFLPTILSRKCHEHWKEQAWRRTRWQTWNHDRETKFFQLHCIRKSNLLRCGFWPLIHSCEHSSSSQSFPSDNAAGVSSRTLQSRKYPILWRTLWSLHAFALLHWLLWLS